MSKWHAPFVKEGNFIISTLIVTLPEHQFCNNGTLSFRTCNNESFILLVSITLILFSLFSTCTNGTFACGKESCEEQIICPKNQVYRKGVTACRKTCELYGREMVCDSDVLMDGCVCDESNNQTTYMAPDVSRIR